jgi:Ca2+-transporting ATPase
LQLDRNSEQRARLPTVAMEPVAQPTSKIPAAPPQSWAAEAESVLLALDVEPSTGLTPSRVRERRRHYGPNRLRQTKRRSGWRTLWDQVASPIVALLATATLVAFAFDERLEAFAIGVVIIINTSIGFLTERRAVHSMEALRQLSRVRATVRRAGTTCVVAAEELVPGDIVLLDAGDVLTGDLRLVMASRLQVDESALTGESLPVEKSAVPCPPDAPLADRSSMVFKGTAVTRGSAEGVVVATGIATELGQISELVAEAEPEVTPLEARLDRLGRRLIVLTLAVAALVAGTSIWAGRGVYLSIEVALALGVAAVPEGLPIVATIALARGMWRMARRRALVERLSAVETLGSTSIILADKTGTLTENRMAVAELVLPDDTTFEFVASGASSPGGILLDGKPVSPLDAPLLRAAFTVAALCNNAALPGEHADSPPATGDPTEIALLLGARAAGLERDRLLESFPEMEEIAFDSDLKLMATLHREDDGVLAAVKGAPESVIPLCSHVASANGAVIPLEATGQAHWLATVDKMAARGQRVLALATRRLSETSVFRYDSLTLQGLVGLLDPPRPGVRQAIDACRTAGIQVVMVTGDHGATAWHIAAATGLIDPAAGDEVSFLDARAVPSFDALTSTEVDAILKTPVIARATPRQKLELIALFQRNDFVVGMTGDGVNDAPALKKADIGIAMGMRGTQVAREAADMVLQDDEFDSIVEAVGQGRAIFKNIRKFVVYLMSCNVSEILAVSIASLAQGPLPLVPLQILFLNLVTDVFPALALGVGEGSPTLMREPPRQADDPLVARRHWRRIFGMSSVIALAVLSALFIAVVALEKPMRQATTISFVTLALAQLWHIFSMRERRAHWLRNEITGNPWVWSALLLCLALIGLGVYWPPLAIVLSVENPGMEGWSLAVAMSLVPLVVGQIALALPRRRASQVRTAAD